MNRYSPSKRKQCISDAMILYKYMHPRPTIQASYSSPISTDWISGKKRSTDRELQTNIATMACNKITAAATCVLVLSLVLPSGNKQLHPLVVFFYLQLVMSAKNKSLFDWADVQGVKWTPCYPFVRSRIGSCRGGDRQDCKGRCLLEGYSGGICDTKDICYCIQTDCSSDGKLNGGQRGSPVPAPESRGAWARAYSSKHISTTIKEFNVWLYVFWVI